MLNSTANLPLLSTPYPHPTTGEPVGLFAGLITTPEGEHCALVLLPDLPDTPNHTLDWPAAAAWAAELGDGASLPTRAESALLFANVRSAFEPRWHWTCEQYSPHTAWNQSGDGGGQDTSAKDCQGRARAVRRFKLSA